MKIIRDWRTRDSIWIISILIGIIIAILTWRLNDKDNVVNIISMFASGASIILAIVAIIQSTIYNSSSSELYARMTEKISVLQSDVGLMRDNILRSTNTIIDKSPIPKDEKEELKRRIEELGPIEDNTHQSTLSSSITVSNKNRGKLLDRSLRKLINILQSSIGKEIRYRTEETMEFKNDKLLNYNYDSNKYISIELEKESVITKNINEISFTEYDDRIDVWIYGDKTNRFNISKQEMDMNE